MALTLSTAQDGYDPRKASTGSAAPVYDWDLVAREMGPRVWAKWHRPAYGMMRADRGNGPVARGAVIPGIGSPWATVCEHGTVYRTGTGGAAEEAGRGRAQWCPACKTGAPGTVPLLSARQAVTTPTTPTVKAAPAPADTTTKAPATASKAPATTAPKSKA